MINNFVPGFGWFGMGFGFVFMILFWGLIIWLIVWIVTQSTKPKRVEKTESAIEILKKRFAKGEISKKQFEEMKKSLR
jgi:putative membrane protein